MKLELSLERCQQVHFVLHLKLLLTIVKYQLQEPHKVDQSDWNYDLEKGGKEELSSPVVLHRLRMNRRRGSEKLANLLSSEVVELQILTF